MELSAITARLDKLESDHRDSRDLLIEIRTTLKHVDSKLDVHNERINKREAENDELRREVAELKKAKAELDGSIRATKFWGSVIAGVLMMLEVVSIYGRFFK